MMKAIVIAVMILVLVTNAYVVWRMYQILPYLWLKIAVPALYVLALLAFFGSFAGMLSEAVWAAKLNSMTSTVLVVWLCSFMAFLLMDIGRLCRLVPKDFAAGSTAGSAIVLGAIALVLIITNIDYRTKHRETLEITTSKKLEKPLKIVMASDLHIGYTNSRKELAKWIDKINDEHPDLVIFGGDIIDNSVRPLFDDDFAEEFHRLTAPAYAAFGNHEFISGAEQSMKFYREAGLNVLRDSVVHVKGITLIGRDDLYSQSVRTAAAESAPHRRQSLSALMQGIDPEEFTILIDHQPYHLEEAQEAKVDFQFSGHTHGGQVWPITVVTDLMYEKAWGYHRRGETQYYISSGLGIWGPKFRLGSQSEFLVLTVTPENS